MIGKQRNFRALAAIVGGLAVFFGFAPALAQPLPFNIEDANPFVAIHALPLAGVAADADASLGIMLTATNAFDTQSHGDEYLFTDFERYRLLFSYQQAFLSHWRLRAELPFITYTGGRLDHFIKHFHEFFGFPQNRRDEAPVDRLGIHYQVAGQDVWRLQNASQGVGDATLALGRELPWRNWDTRLWLQLKLPSGDPEYLTGSGATDLALWWQARTMTEGDWRSFGHVGLSWLGEGDVLSRLQRDVVWFGSWGAEWHGLAEYAVLQAQFSAHTGLYDSDLKLLGGNAMQISFGGWRRFGKDWRMELALVEDILVSSVPDVSFHFGLTYRY